MYSYSFQLHQTILVIASIAMLLFTALDIIVDVLVYKPRRKVITRYKGSRRIFNIIFISAMVLQIMLFQFPFVSSFRSPQFLAINWILFFGLVCIKTYFFSDYIIAFLERLSGKRRIKFQ